MRHLIFFLKMKILKCDNNQSKQIFIMYTHMCGCVIIMCGNGDTNHSYRRSKTTFESDLLNAPGLHIYVYPRCARMVTKSFVHFVDVSHFDLEGKRISDGLLDSSSVLHYINQVEMPCVTCLCGSKCLRRVCAGFTF